MIRKIKTLLEDVSLEQRNSLSEWEEKEIRLGLEQLQRGEGISWEDFLKQVS